MKIKLTKMWVYSDMKSVGVILLTLLSFHASAQIAAGKCKFLGNVFSGSAPSSFTTYWNQVTPENDGKWGSVEATQNTMSWSGLDAAYNFAKTNGFKFKQHNFVWGQQQPSWITALPADQQKAEVEQWIQLYGARFPNTDFIDVVNEPFHAIPSYYAALGGTGATGYDWVVWCFQKARQYCPNAKLLINEYNVINDDNATNQYVQLIKVLNDQNLLDGIGVQGHYFELGTATVATLQSNLTKLGNTGLPVYISEYEVDLADDAAQQAKYQEQFTALWQHKAVAGVTLWGYQPGMWKPNGILLRGDGTERPALTWLKQYVSTTSITCVQPGLPTAIEPSLNEMDDFVIYPNPVTNKRFSMDYPENVTAIAIVNIYGDVVKEIVVQPSQSTSQVELDVASGIYIIKFTNNEQKHIYKKLIIR